MKKSEATKVIYRHAGLKEDRELQPQELKQVSETILNNLLPNRVAYAVLSLFIVTNIFVAILIGVAFCYDVYFVEYYINNKVNIKYERIITSELIKSLILGITIQVGATTVIIVRYYYNKEKKIESKLQEFTDD